MSTGGRDPIHSADEILATVQEIQDDQGLPFVTPQLLEEHSQYGSDKTARINLNGLHEEGDLSRAEVSGRLYYWLPDGEPVDLNEEDIQLEGSFTPRPEDMYWVRKYNSAFSFTGFGLALFGIGLGLATMVAQSVPESVSTITGDAGAIFLAVGIVAMFMGGIAMLLTYLGKQAATQGWISEEPLQEGHIANLLDRARDYKRSMGG